jgi:hypothetical protein
VYPAIILVNKTGKRIAYKQTFISQHDKSNTNLRTEDRSPVFTLDQDEQVPFHWPNSKQERKLSVRYCYDQSDLSTSTTAATATSSPQYCWSTAFKIDQPDHFQLKIPKSVTASSEYDLINVHIKVLNGTTFVIFGRKEDVFSFCIRNETSTEIIIQQKVKSILFSLREKYDDDDDDEDEDEV